MIYKRTPFAHLNAMQRILTISDSRTVIEYPRCERLSRNTESFVELMDTLKICLRRDPTERATIPDLLSHRFLVPDNIEKLSRGVFEECIVQHLTKTREKLLPKLHENTMSVNLSEVEASTAKLATLNRLERQVADSMWKFLAENAGLSLSEIPKNGRDALALNPVSIQK